jgi:hypothetical protein
MKRQRQSWATRKLPPLTSAEIEKHLDFVAWLMDKAGGKAHLYLPVWEWLEELLAEQKRAEAMIESARQRLRRSQDRTAA